MFPNNSREGVRSVVTQLLILVDYITGALAGRNVGSTVRQTCGVTTAFPYRTSHQTKDPCPGPKTSVGASTHDVLSVGETGVGRGTPPWGPRGRCQGVHDPTQEGEGQRVRETGFLHEDVTVNVRSLFFSSYRDTRGRPRRRGQPQQRRTGTR